MVNLNNKYFLALAIATPLPKCNDEDSEVGLIRSLSARRRSSFRPTLKVEIPTPSTPIHQKSTPSTSKVTLSSQNKRGKKRKSEFTIFKDQYPYPSTPTPKRFKTNIPRTSLTNHETSANSPPILPALAQDTPFSLSSEDHNWENLENYTPWRQRPQSRTPTPSPLNPTTPSTGTPPPPLRNQRPIPPRHNVPTAISPANKTLYNIVGHTDWRVAEDIIRSSYRRRARTMHPDHASTTGKRVAATEAMQRLNAAKDSLLDKRAKTVYHCTGELPWSG